MNKLKGVPVVQYRDLGDSYLAGIETIVPYKITPQLAEMFDSYRAATNSQSDDWEALRKELGALEIKPGDEESYENFSLMVNLPDTELDYDLAMKQDDRLSSDPRLAFYAAPQHPLDDEDFPVEEGSKAAWWALHRNEWGCGPKRKTAASLESKVLLDRARNIHFAKDWEDQFWRDYVTELCDGLKMLRHPDDERFKRFMVRSDFLHHQTYGQTETPHVQIAEDCGIILVPRYSAWELDTQQSNPDGSQSKGKQPVAIHLQIIGAEPVSYAEAFTILQDAGRHDDIYTMGQINEESWAEFNPVNSNLSYVPRYQYFHLSPDREQALVEVEAAKKAYDAEYEAMTEKYGVEKFSIDRLSGRPSDGKKSLQAFIAVDGDTWRPGWKPESKGLQSGKKSWWKIHPESDHLDEELTSYLRHYFANDPVQAYFEALQKEIVETALPTFSNISDEETSFKDVAWTLGRNSKRYAHTLGTAGATLLAYPSFVFADEENESLMRAFWRHPDWFSEQPKQECDRLAIFLKNTQALTYAEAGALLEGTDVLPAATALIAKRPDGIILLDKRRLAI